MNNQDKITEKFASHIETPMSVPIWNLITQELVYEIGNETIDRKSVV